MDNDYTGEIQVRAMFLNNMCVHFIFLYYSWHLRIQSYVFYCIGN